MSVPPVMSDPASAPPPSSVLPLELREVCFDAGGKRLIKALTLTLEAGLSSVIIGPNGAGKSLLLRLCHGLLKPSSGAIV